MIGWVYEGEYGKEEKSELVQKTLGEYGHGEDVDAPLARRRLALINQQRPGQEQDANRRADARCQPLADLAPHYCNNNFYLLVLFLFSSIQFIQFKLDK